MYALAFLVPEEDGSTSWTYEFETTDFSEALDNLFDARNDAAAGIDHWAGSQIAIEVLRDGKVCYEILNDGSRVE